jgi:hypothetical protein
MKKKSKIKPKIKVNKLSENPLFIKFLNWEGDKYSIELFLERLYDSFEEDKDKDIVIQKKNNLTDDYLDNLTNFQKAFRKHYVETANSQNISENFLMWLNNTYKYIKEDVNTYLNDETRKISIKDPEGRWFESLICYNFIMTFNYFGADILKSCPVCGDSFCHKGKYSKYCSDGCKSKGMKKK